ncbi:MAG: hypothetical protein OIF58_05100 [Cohaesibacter sp.]|nr:hypothetical protein [Cohaesibacter sp.]
MEVVRKGFFVEIDECPKTSRRLEERWVDTQGRLCESAHWNYHPEEMTLTRIKYDPETQNIHAQGEPARTETCLVSGIVFEEEYFDQGEYHREDGDAWICRNRHTGADEYRGRWLNDQEYEITPDGMVPFPE